MQTDTIDSRTNGRQYDSPNAVSKAIVTDGHTGMYRTVATNPPISRHIKTVVLTNLLGLSKTWNAVQVDLHGGGVETIVYDGDGQVWTLSLNGLVMATQAELGRQCTNLCKAMDDNDKKINSLAAEVTCLCENLPDNSFT